MRYPYTSRLIGAAGLLILGLAAQVSADATEASIRLLRQATTAHPRDTGRLALLVGLRQLRDSALKPFFERLTRSPDWAMQVQAVLGLAELDPNKRLDHRRIPDLAPNAQEAVIAAALDLGLLAPDQFPEILHSDNLHPMGRLFILSEQVSLDLPVDTEALLHLTRSDESHVAGLSSCLLAQLGQDDVFLSFLEQLPPSAENTHELTVWLLDAIHRYKLTAGIEWVERILMSPQTDPEVAYRGVLTLLELDPEKGILWWNKCLGNNPSSATQVRYGLLLLTYNRRIPLSTYERLNGEGDELLSRIIEAGRTLTQQTDPTEALQRLFDLGHDKAMDRVFAVAAELPSEQQAEVYGFAIGRLTGGATSDAASVSLAAQATAKLFEIDPGEVFARLQSAEDDGVMQEAILLGLFQANSPAVRDEVRKLPRIGSGRTDSLALLLAARHSASLEENEIRQLGTIASGGGRLSATFQVQAAWLYLKHTGKLETALAEVFEH